MLHLFQQFQSASALAIAELYKFSYFDASFKFLNPSFIALSVLDDIQRRFNGLFVLHFCNIHLATNSPSRPASVAITIFPTSSLFI